MKQMSNYQKDEKDKFGPKIYNHSFYKPDKKGNMLLIIKPINNERTIQ